MGECICRDDGQVDIAHLSGRWTSGLVGMMEAVSGCQHPWTSQLDEKTQTQKAPENHKYGLYMGKLSDALFFWYSMLFICFVFLYVYPHGLNFLSHIFFIDLLLGMHKNPRIA